MEEFFFCGMFASSILISFSLQSSSIGSPPKKKRFLRGFPSQLWGRRFQQGRLELEVGEWLPNIRTEGTIKWSETSETQAFILNWSFTLPETNIAPENRLLEKEIPIGFLGANC